MKKTFMLLAMFASFSGLVGGQSLQDNEFYRKMVELKQQSESAFEEGDYLKAKRLAEEARSHKEMSDQWIETQLNAYRARSALVRLKDRLAEVSQQGAAENFPEEYALGTALHEQAFEAFHDKEDYPASLAASNQALDILAVVVYLPREDTGLPSSYQVRLIPENRDSLWNIAAYDFVYGDPWKWTMLYDANREIMPKADNPDYILPGMVLTIPQLSGEKRWGAWVDGEILKESP